ncbi:MAG TPA: hypothetical protein VGV89_02150 [Thermoplasmata archaeon]|nr:hypothetical protein [Thermoplasmata archaeon]
MLVAVLMAIAPAASATKTVAPFTGKTVKATVSEQIGCGSAKATTKPSWSLTTGAFHWAANGAARTCGAPFALVVNSIGLLEQEYFSMINVAVPSGSHSVQVNYSSAWSMSGSISATGSCATHTYRYSTFNYTTGFCIAESFAELFANTYIYDASNNSYIYQTSGSTGVNAFNYSENYTDIYWTCTVGGSCTSYNYTYSSASLTFGSSGSSAGSTAYINGTFVAGHHYYVISDIFGYVLAQTTGWPHASAKVTVNAGALGNGVTLNSITVV